MNALGCDVSVWDDNNSTAQQIDFGKMKQAGASFVFIKASQANWKDQDMIYNWKAAKDAGLIRGAYHFMTWDVAPVVQAEYFCSLLYKDPGELPPVADFEWWKGTAPSNALKLLSQFVERVEKNIGKTPIIYTGPSFWKDYGSVDVKWARFPLWIANYKVSVPMVPKPWEKFTFWQYTDTGNGPAFGAESNELDMNQFNGTEQELRVFCGLAKPEPTAEEKLAALWAAHPELHPQEN